MIWPITMWPTMRSLLFQRRPSERMPLLNGMKRYTGFGFRNYRIPYLSINIQPKHLWYYSDGELAHRLEELLTLEKQPDIVLRKTASILENRVTDGGIDPRVVGALDHILQNRGQGSISSLAGQVNLSQRRLQQLFRDYFGLSAKSYSRVVRLQHHTYELLTGRSIDTIVPDGYYDQSHFLHDLKRQTGLLPDAYVDVLNDPAHKPAYLSSNLFL